MISELTLLPVVQNYHLYFLLTRRGSTCRGIWIPKINMYDRQQTFHVFKKTSLHPKKWAYGAQFLLSASLVLHFLTSLLIPRGIKKFYLNSLHYWNQVKHWRDSSKTARQRILLQFPCHSSQNFLMTVWFRLGHGLQDHLTLTLCDYFLWVYLKDKVYCNKPTTTELKEKITMTINEITSEILTNRFENLCNRMDVCQEICGGYFQHLI